MVLVGASILHFFLQLLLGSLIAGVSPEHLPSTIVATLMLLVLVFFGVQGSLFLLADKFGQSFHDKSVVCYLFLMPATITLTLVLRLPYSSVFLFWGSILLILIWYITSIFLERQNIPIIGLTKDAISEFQGLIDLNLAKTISPDMRDSL